MRKLGWFLLVQEHLVTKYQEQGLDLRLSLTTLYTVSINIVVGIIIFNYHQMSSRI